MATELQKKWQEKILRAKKVREDWAREFRVDLGRAYFEGKQNPGYPQDEWISIPKIYSHLKASMPYLYSLDPYFYVKVSKSYEVSPFGLDQNMLAEMERKAKIRQAMLNYLKGELKLKPRARMALQDAMFAYGVLKVRHVSDFEKHPQAGEEIVDDDGNPIPDPDTGQPQVYPDELPINKRYEVLRVHPDDFLWDEDAGPLPDTWGWVAQRIRSKKEDVEKDKRYKRKAARSVKPRAKEDEEKGPIASWFYTRQKGKEAEDEFVDLWEVYDLKNGETLTLAEDADDVLIDPRPTSPGIEGDPFGILRFTLRDKSPYPIPPVSPAIDPQKEVSLARSRWMTHRKRFNRKYEVDITRVESEEELDKLEFGGDGTIIRKNGPGPLVEPIQDAPLDQQGIQELIALDNDVVEALGTPGPARGIANSDSATEASILDARLEIREGDALSLVVDWITDVARKLDQLVQFHIDRDQAVRITGPQGEMWEVIRETDYQEIHGEFEYTVNVGASRPRLPDIERSQWIAFLSQVVIPFPHLLTAPNVMKRMAEMFHIEDEAALKELAEIGQKVMNGAMPFPGATGGGPPGGDPASQILGAALGQLGGTANGGGADTVVR